MIRTSFNWKPGKKNPANTQQEGYVCPHTHILMGDDMTHPVFVTCVPVVLEVGCIIDEHEKVMASHRLERNNEKWHFAHQTSSDEHVLIKAFNQRHEGLCVYPVQFRLNKRYIPLWVYGYGEDVCNKNQIDHCTMQVRFVLGIVHVYSWVLMLLLSDLVFPSRVLSLRLRSFYL